MKEKLLGVIGGMGPLATAQFMERVIRHTSAKRDQDHINMIVSNHAGLPDRTESILKGTKMDFLNEIQKDFSLMNQLQVDFIVIPCNTAHYYMPEYHKMTSIEIIDMVEETVREVQRQNFHQMVVLGTEGTLKTEIYPNKAKKYDLKVILPTEEEQGICHQMIHSVKENQMVDRSPFDQILQKYLQERILPVLACTELSCLNLSSDHLDAMDVLVRRTIEKMGKSYTCKTS